MRALLPLVVILLATAPLSCGRLIAANAPPTAVTGGFAPPSTALAATHGYPLTVRDCGRDLTFYGPPQRVVTGYQPALEIMLSLGLADRVIGRTHFAEGAAFLPGQQTLYNSIPQVSPNIELPSKEQLLALRPDFVLAVNYADFDPEFGHAGWDDLADAGAQTYLASWDCPGRDYASATIEDTYSDINNIGAIFGVSDRARALVDSMKQQITAVQERLRAAGAGQPPLRVLAYDSGSDPYVVYGAGLLGNAIALAGGTSVFADKPGVSFFPTDATTLAASDPQAYVVVDYQPGASFVQKANLLYQLLPAAAASTEQRAIRLDAVATHPGVRNADMVVTIARGLYPAAFSDP